MLFDRYPIRRVQESETLPAPRDAWPATIPAVRQLLDEGLDLGPATVLVGDNGAGKSTIVEAIAATLGMSPEGGSPNTMHATRPSESPLVEHLTLVKNAGATRFGYFLRAETMHGLYTYFEQIRSPGPRFHEMSHGESFLELVGDKFREHGLWVLDEPESALSFTGCMRLLGHLKELLEDDRNQVLLSTHSPLLAALPGAVIYEVGDWGLRRCDWDDLDLVRLWRTFFDGPERFFRYL